MATYSNFLLLLLSSFISSMALESSSRSHDLDVAIQEMAKANYFTFVTLINISPLDHRFQENITFLMPNDRILSNTRISHDSVSDFLLRHSIPSPLLFEHLQHIPTGSRIPSSKPEYMLHINNNGGRRNFSLNNVKITSPNICTEGFSIRCHGVDAVLTDVDNDTLPTCPHPGAPPEVVAAPPRVPPPAPLSPVPPVAAAPSPVGGFNQTPEVADSGKRASGSSMSYGVSLKLFITFIFAVFCISGYNM